MEKKRLFREFIFACLAICILTLPASAISNLEPYIPEAVTSAPENQTVPQTSATPSASEYVEEYFGYDPGAANTDLVNKVTGGVNSIVSTIMCTILGVFAGIYAVQIVIEAACIGSKPIALFFAKVVPIQLYSSEIVQFTHLPHKNKEEGDTTPAAAEGDKKMTPFKFIMQKRLLQGLILFVILALIASGVLFNIINAICGAIIDGLQGIV